MNWDHVCQKSKEEPAREVQSHASFQADGKSERPQPTAAQKEHGGLGSPAADCVDPRAAPRLSRPQ